MPSWSPARTLRSRRCAILDELWGVHVEDALTAVPLIEPLGATGAGRRRIGRRVAGDPTGHRARDPGDDGRVGGRARPRSCARPATRSGLPAEVVAERAEEFGRKAGRDRYPLATARALAPPPVVAAELTLPLVRPGGHLVLWAGRWIDRRSMWPPRSLRRRWWTNARPASGGGCWWCASWGRRRIGSRGAPASRPGVRWRSYPLRHDFARLRPCQSEGRGRQDHHGDQHGGVRGRGRTPVLLIDLDPQANATTGLGFRPDAARGEQLRPAARPSAGRRGRRDGRAKPRPRARRIPTWPPRRSS